MLSPVAESESDLSGFEVGSSLLPISRQVCWPLRTSQYPVIDSCSGPPRYLPQQPEQLVGVGPPIFRMPEMPPLSHAQDSRAVSSTINSSHVRSKSATHAMESPHLSAALEAPREGTGRVPGTGSREHSPALSTQPTAAHEAETPSPVARQPRRPQPSLRHFSSMDKLLSYYEEKRLRESSSVAVRERFGSADSANQHDIPARHIHSQGPYRPRRRSHVAIKGLKLIQESTAGDTPHLRGHRPRPKFRGMLTQVGFCFTVCMTQFLAEYLISGFALELSRLVNDVDSNGMGLFWPASLLTLVMSSMLLIFARLSDMYSGYPCFMFGVTWLTIWTLIPGFVGNIIVLDVSRAMQGLAIAAFTPSGYAMIGATYPEGRQRNMIMGLYSGCAPLGFFFGILTAGALPASESQWYFWTSALLSCLTALAAYLSVPRDTERESRKDLKMDWIGAVFINGGLILVAYALAVEPYSGESNDRGTGFSSRIFLGPFIGGLSCLLIAIWVEGWVAKCPLLPLSFFRPKSAFALTIAGLAFYATYGVWLYNSVNFLQSRTGTTTPDNPSGILLALWYLPTAIGGIVLCLVSSTILHVFPIKILLLISGTSWVAAPMLFAVNPLPLRYWSATLPSMLFATLGIDLTYTITCVFFSAVQPLKFQGLSGAMCSILVNLAMSFSLPISEIVRSASKRHLSSKSMADQTNGGYRAAFIYGTISAAIGILIVVLFVDIPPEVVGAKPADEENTSEWGMSSGQTV